MNNYNLTIKTNDFDTLGGRLYRARSASDRPLKEIAHVVGVETKTLRAWERDQAEPRANRLAMLAGILGVSPSWLLFGRGEAISEQPAT